MGNRRGPSRLRSPTLSQGLRRCSPPEAEHAVLAIVTTLEFDPESHNYKKNYVEKLSRAARKYLTDSGSAAAFVLMNRPRDWNADQTQRRD
jgi:hypothetical protein